MSNINFNGPEFRKLSKDKLAFLIELSKDIEQMPSSNSINYIITLTSKLKNKNIHFTDNEMNLLYQVLTNKMSDKEREKFHLLKNLISKNSF